MEIIANDVQLVDIGQNILFTDTVAKGNKWISHRPGSGLITLKGIRGCECQGTAKYLVTFSGNIAVPATGTIPAEISVAIAVDGEPIQATRMRFGAGAVNYYYNVSASTYIEAPNNCCSKISVENTSTQAINVQNANLIVVRVA